jgi:putative intracellular protease/amidase
MHHPPPSALRRRLAAQRPGRPTAIACVIAIALAAAGLEPPRPHTGAAADGRPGAAHPAADSHSEMALAQTGLQARRERSAPSRSRRAAR